MSEEHANQHEVSVAREEFSLGTATRSAGQTPGVAVSTYEMLEELLQPRGPSLKDFVTLLIKRKRLILATAISIISIGCIYALTSPNQFTATSTVEIRGYAPVLGNAELEALLPTDTRKLSYQSTTTAKLTQAGLADQVLSRGDLGEEVHQYFKKQRSFLSRVRRWISRNIFSIGGADSRLDEEDPRYHHRQTFINSYLRLIQVNPIHETALVQVRATTTDRRLSQRIANEHAEGLINHLGAERREELSTQVETLKTHADELQKKLAEAEAEVSRYTEQNELVGLAIADGNQGSLMLSHLMDLNKMLTATQKERVETESKYGSIKEGSSNASPILDDETIKDLRTKLKEAESESAALSKLVTAEYPKLVELQGKIESLRSTIRQEREGNLAALKTQFQSDIAAEKLIFQQFEDQLKKAHEMSKQLVQYNFLQRESASLRDLSQSVLKALNETKIGASSSKSNVTISDYAPIPRNPSAPRRGIIIVFSIVLGAMAGVGLAVIREVLDSTIKVSDDAQAALGIPTLGIIPSFAMHGGHDLMDRDLGPVAKVVAQIPWVRDRFGAGKAKAPAAPSATIADEPQLTTEVDAEQSDSEIAQDSERQIEDREVIAGSIGVTKDKLPKVDPSLPAAVAVPQAAVLDALRTLRANILFSSTQNSSRVIMVASSREREGKTSVVTNLAVTFARASQRTLLIDGDFRRPKVAKRFGLQPGHLGLVDLLAGQAELKEILVPSGIDNLTLLPAGSDTLNPTELLGSEKMASLIQFLRGEFDVILLDSAPVLPVADSLVLAQFAETVLFVIRSGKTEKAVAQDAVRRLRRVGARVRGLVLNDFDPGVGSYSSDRYSVSPYNVVEVRPARTIIPSENGVVQNTNDPEGEPPLDDPENTKHRAVG